MTRVRSAHHTVALIDDYCAHFRPVFHTVRHFEQFTQLLLGLVAETKRKSLPRLAKSVQGEAQARRHFLAHAEWSLGDVRRIRLGLLLRAHAPGHTAQKAPAHSERAALTLDQPTESAPRA